MFFICISKMAARNVVTNIICFTGQPIAPACGADVPSARIRVATGARLHAAAATAACRRAGSAHICGRNS